MEKDPMEAQFSKIEHTDCSFDPETRWRAIEKQLLQKIKEIMSNDNGGVLPNSTQILMDRMRNMFLEVSGRIGMMPAMQKIIGEFNIEHKNLTDPEGFDDKELICTRRIMSLILINIEANKKHLARQHRLCDAAEGKANGKKRASKQ